MWVLRRLAALAEGRCDVRLGCGHYDDIDDPDHDRCDESSVDLWDVMLDPEGIDHLDHRTAETRSYRQSKIRLKHDFGGYY